MSTGVNCFIMKARTRDDTWYTFTIGDLPTKFNTKEFVLLNKTNTPRMKLNSIRRGDDESGLFEGDIIFMDGTNWLICYERGFYAINGDYISRYLYTLKDYEFIGTCSEIKHTVPINFRVNHLFKYKDNVFRIDSIVGGFDGNMILRFAGKPVSPTCIQQECCLKYKGYRVYLGDTFEGGTVELKGGRVVLNKEDLLFDLGTGGNLDGYISGSSRGD